MRINIKKFWEDDRLCEYASETEYVSYAQYLACLKSRVVVLNDRIDDSVIDTIVLPLMAMDNDGTGEPITFILNTTGGYLGSGTAIVHTLEHMKTPTTIYIVGEAFSMGFYIAMAGYRNPKVKTICTPYARAMYHMSIFSDETIDEPYLQQFQEDYDKTILYDYIMSHSRITREMLDEWEGTEKYFTAKELKELGIAEIE